MKERNNKNKKTVVIISTVTLKAEVHHKNSQLGKPVTLFPDQKM
jgi:hypothetical protein